MTNTSNKDAYDEVFENLQKHNKWFENSIPLIASENVPSPAVREAIISDFGNRYAEGWPGAEPSPRSPDGPARSRGPHR